MASVSMSNKRELSNNSNQLVLQYNTAIIFMGISLGIWKKIIVQYLGRIFVCHQCCRNRRIAGYVTIATVLMTDKKTSKDG